MVTVHRLVALHFVAGSGEQINHINGDKLDNRACNLEWCSAEHNRKHAQDNWLHAHGTKMGTAKLNEDEVTQLRRRYSNGETMKALAKEKGLSVSTIHRAITKRTWRHV